MKKGLVSTIIPVYNRPVMLCEAVQSVLDQTYRPIEIIVVNDGSTDNTLDVASSLSVQHSEITVISIKNSGPGPAREAGKRIAKGEYIQYLDSDDLLVENKFSIQIAGLMDNTDCDVSYCRQDYYNMAGDLLNVKRNRSGEYHRTMFPAMLGGRLWGTPVPIYRKSLLDKCGPWLDIQSEEDWEYDCRVASHDVNLHYVSESLVTIRRHNSTHLGMLDENATIKIKDRAIAYKAILQHALSANIDPNNPAFQKFIRMTFKLSRTCGGMGLIVEAQNLFNDAYLYSQMSNRISFDFHVYALGSKIIGWKNMGKLTIMLDKIRT